MIAQFFLSAGQSGRQKAKKQSGSSYIMVEILYYGLMNFLALKYNMLGDKGL